MKMKVYSLILCLAFMVTIFSNLVNAQVFYDFTYGEDSVWDFAGRSGANFHRLNWRIPTYQDYPVFNYVITYGDYSDSSAKSIMYGTLYDTYEDQGIKGFRRIFKFLFSGEPFEITNDQRSYSQCIPFVDPDNIEEGSFITYGGELLTSDPTKVMNECYLFYRTYDSNAGGVSWAAVACNSAPFKKFKHDCIVFEGFNNGLGAFFCWGGINDSDEFDNIGFYGTLPVNSGNYSSFTITYSGELTQSDPAPEARAGHSLVYAGENTVYLFGGQNDVQFFRDVWKGVLSETQVTWTELSPTNLPDRRSFHSAVDINGTRMVIYGGKQVDTVVFDDIWSFDYETEEWTKVEAKNIPVARHSASMEVFDEQTVLIYGGRDADSNELNDWYALDLEITCNYFCDHISYCTNSKDSCSSRILCEQPTYFKCDLDCVEHPDDCDISCSGTQLKCWNGECVDDLSNCIPWPKCPFEQYRCDDGSCSEEPCSETVDSCGANQIQCVDGTCGNCIPYDGCAPGENSYFCLDGNCTSGPSECECTSSNGTGVSCAGGFCAIDESCSEDPYFFTSLIEVELISVLEADDPSYIYTIFYPESVLDTDAAGIIIISRIDGAPANDVDIHIDVQTVSTSEIKKIGPFPSWEEYYSHSYFASAPVKVSIQNDMNIVEENLIFDLFLKEQSTILDSTKCLATAVPFYLIVDQEYDYKTDHWQDEGKYFEAYREWYEENGPVTEKYGGPTSADLNIEIPEYRWECLNLSEYPRYIQSPEIAERYKQFKGNKIYGNGTGIYAIITIELPLEIPAITFDNTTGHIVIIIVAGTFLFILSVIVGIQTYQEKVLPS
eukprot:TRINITY_DN10674_c0_g1_i1.p1 TRINITY_DN10674_c0_g1~~TRINITY_DN10674_c0_g1_i1.p1  ORF type:complete len:834 (+),score=162.38 TRINITY_DN10674_c0_g1_i1:88-2589(+)